jgi:hypothetical protein
MALKIVSAEERMKEQTSIKGVIAGPHGIGKTSLLWTLPQEQTLFINIEAGGLAVQNWPGDTISPSTWDECLDVACIFGGPDPSKRADQRYSQAHYDYLCSEHPDMVRLRDKYHIHFWDSISVASRLAWQWATGQPEAFSEKTGAKDTRGVYGLIGRDLVEWLTHIQHTSGKIVWVLCGLDTQDDFANPWKLQIEGAQAANKLPGIFDEIISMAMLQDENGNPYRAFVTQLVNTWKYPAKDRSGCLEMVEPPHLGALIAKIEAGKRLIQPEAYNYTIPRGEETHA